MNDKTEASAGPLVIEKTEHPLPELRTKLLFTSKELVVKGDERSTLDPKESIVIPYGNYTLVIGRGFNEIQVFDGQGRKINGLDNFSTMIVDWRQFKKVGYENYWKMVIDSSLLPPSAEGYRIVTSFPENLQPFITDFIKKTGKNNNSCMMPETPWVLSNERTEQMVFRIGGGHIIIRQQDTGQFIAFQTKTAEGVDLAPRNWVRVDSCDLWTGSLPDQIVSEYKPLRLDGVVNFEKTTDYLALVYDNRLLLVKVGQENVEAVFSDNINGIRRNIAVDPNNSKIIYYCSTYAPRSIVKLDTNGNPAAWSTEALDLPHKFNEIDNLQIDPTGYFFTFELKGEFFILSRDELKVIKKIPNLYNGRLNAQGKIHGVNENGHLVTYEVNFAEVAQQMEERRLSRLATGLTADLFKEEAAIKPAEASVEESHHLVKVRQEVEDAFNKQIQTITALEELPRIKNALSTLRARLQSEGLRAAQIDFITQRIQEKVAHLEQILAKPMIDQAIIELTNKLQGSLTIASISEAKADLANLQSLARLADEQTRSAIRVIEQDFSQKLADVFKREGAVVERDVTEIINGVRAELEGMQTMSEFADWQDFRLPQLISKLGSLASDVPLEAYETQKKILDARHRLQELAIEFETRFREKYAQVRERASEVMVQQVELLRADISSFLARFREKQFKDRQLAETYIQSSQALEAIRTEISELAKRNPDAAREVDRELKAKLATGMSEVERGGLTTVAETGQQMVLFGTTLFPRWEGKVQEKVQRDVDLVFIADDKSKGPGVTADKLLGDIGIMETNSKGKTEINRLFEGMLRENEWRYGSVSYRGEYVPSSYMTQAEYRKIKQDFADWNKGDTSKIRKGLQEKKAALLNWYKSRQPKHSRELDKDKVWAERFRVLLNEYAVYVAENYILLLSRVDRIRNSPETEFANGSGYVPEWQSHWTLDETTEQYLEEMAKSSKMQLDLQEGLLNLKGHAGTGKDVLVKMFCNMTNRPYFSIDCSKWTTEFELSEDVVLEAEDGASKTVKVPSVVLKAITTPGAVLYFNEINAMPEQAQIFLHGLMDEKRTLTLKTSSGKSIRALNSVILMGSMNPGYPGTFSPQFATKSRMVGIEIDYPPLYRQKDEGDTNPNPPISAAEALRVARQVDSLADLTYETNPKHNMFVKIWDSFVNGIQNDAPELSVVQRFDIEAILTMVEFAQKLREGFILKFEKRSASELKGKLTVDQPITGREMRRMAYMLSKMTPEEKATANPELTIRGLISQFFLSHLDNQKEKEEIRTAMATWTSFKRLAA